MSSQSTNNYYTRSSNDATNCIICNPEDSNPTPVTLDRISILETKSLARFDEVQNGLLNVKNIIIKNLQEENERLRKRVSFLDKKSFQLNQDITCLDNMGGEITSR